MSMQCGYYERTTPVIGMHMYSYYKSAITKQNTILLMQGLKLIIRYHVATIMLWIYSDSSSITK